MPPVSTHSSKTFLVIAIVLALVVAGLAVVFFSMPKTDTIPENGTEMTDDTTLDTSDTTLDGDGGATITGPESSDAGMEFPFSDDEGMPDATVSRSKYKNGTYTASGTYRSPAGQETVSITVTVNDDTVTSATFVGNATNPTSMKMQTNFKSGFETQVVGKSIDQVALTVVNGSSLTSKGFMDALAKVKAEAEA